MTAVAIPSGLYVFDHQQALRLCQEQGLTYTSLAAQTGLGYHSVRNYLKGLADPPAGWVGALSLVLGLTPGDLYRVAQEEDVTETRAVEVRPQVRLASRRQRVLLRRPAAS